MENFAGQGLCFNFGRREHGVHSPQDSLDLPWLLLLLADRSRTRVCFSGQPALSGHSCAHGIPMHGKPKGRICIPVNLCQLHSSSQLMQMVLVAHSVCQGLGTSNTSLFTATFHWLPVGLGALEVHFLRCHFSCQLQRWDAEGKVYMKGVFQGGL